jgi:hypothetical protein
MGLLGSRQTCGAARADRQRYAHKEVGWGTSEVRERWIDLLVRNIHVELE